MTRLTATKEFKWEMAHMLTGHEGLCKNVHGHSYKMQVTVSRESRTVLSGPSKGMVLDFSDLKRSIEKELVDHLDHAFMIDGSADGLEKQLHQLLEGKSKLYVVMYRPTAENMAQDFFAQISTILEEHFGNTVQLESVKVWETVTAFAEVSR